MSETSYDAFAPRATVEPQQGRRVPFNDEEMILFVTLVQERYHAVYLNVMVAIFGEPGYVATHETSPRGRKASRNGS